MERNTRNISLLDDINRLFGNWVMKNWAGVSPEKIKKLDEHYYPKKKSRKRRSKKR